MKTDKFNNMISSLQCDLCLARDGHIKLGSLDILLEYKDERLVRDIDLLEELEFLLRYGKAEIHIVEE